MSEDVSKETSDGERASNGKQTAKGNRSSIVFQFKALKKPEQEHYSTENKESPCKICQNRDKKHYSCAECGKQFSKQLAIIAHLRRYTHPPVICKICGLKFNFNHKLQEHMIKHSNKRQFECDVCRKTFKRCSSLTAHKKIHEPKQYLCKRCMKYFTQKTHLEVHMRGHSGVKPYECEVCSKQFTQKTTLNNHMLKHTGVKPHRCQLCNQRFRQVSNLNQHIRNYHPDNNHKKRNLKRKQNSLDKNKATKGKVKLNIPKNSQNEDQPSYRSNKKRSSISLAWFLCKMCKKTVTGRDNISKHRCS